MSASQPTTGTTPPSGSIQVGTGQDFELKAGQSARVTTTPITVIFRSVSQDSRCPSDVTCVWAGDGAVKLGLESTTAPSVETTVHTMLDPKTVDFSGYRIRVVSLAPYPKSGSKISADKYVVTLNVSAP
ncbi:MAG TPA: hypothetical protein VM053_02330 [Gemmatimonadaceae bacterium]|nr:hypothetical protein [Gemmatimonadaceae bacterium]